MKQPDLLIVGAGPVGCVMAERAAAKGLTSVIVEKRNHIAGNCYDFKEENGVLVHKYGPHYFRTNNPELIDYLSRFTDWLPANYEVKSEVGGRLFPFPINRTTLELFFDRTFTETEAHAFLDAKREHIPEIHNSEDFILSRVGRELYEAFYLGYTQKQWDMHPSQLDKSVCGRIPIRFNRDHRYVDHNFQQLPKNGYTEMFRQMIDNELIDLKLEADFFLIKEEIKPALATIYTGPIDLYFDYQFGKLPWRSLDFEFTFHSGELVQPCVQINHPNSHDYTRSVEIKHITQQEHLGTVVCKEYPRAKGEPYYPIPTTSNKELYLKYKTLAKAETLQNKVFFTGRLAQYTYINTDEAIEMALKLAEELFD